MVAYLSSSLFLPFSCEVSREMKFQNHASLLFVSSFSLPICTFRWLSLTLACISQLLYSADHYLVPEITGAFIFSEVTMLLRLFEGLLHASHAV